MSVAGECRGHAETELGGKALEDVGGLLARVPIERLREVFAREPNDVKVVIEL